ncbi:MAG: DUF3572 domain-containing protein [Sphingobium sp.]
MTMPIADRIGNGDDAHIVALQVLGWILTDDRRAHRFLALTGLDAERLRASANDPAVLSASIDFLKTHEPDLLACSDALGISPETLAGIDRMLTT